MAKISYIQTNFTAGELSPRMLGRVDVSRYQNGVKRLENAVIAVQGGVMRTWGTEFIAEVKDSDKQTRLIPYIFNREQAYIVEFGHKYCAIFKDGDLTAEIESPYTEAMLFNINYVQGADTMFLAHSDIPIHRLRRVSDSEWTLAEAPFIVKPYDEMGEYPDVELTLSTTLKGEATATLTNTTNFSWLAADLGRTLSCGTGIAEITAITNASVVKVNIITHFKENKLAAKTWHLEGTPLTTIKPTNGTEGQSPEKEIMIGDTVTLTLGLAGFRASDKGKYIKFNKGLYEITTINSATVAKSECKTAPTSKASAVSWGWSLMSSIWSDQFGYPCAVTLHNQRLFCGGTKERPQTIWMSRTAEYLNFQLSTEDDDAAAFTMSSDQINPIVHLTQTETPIVLTYGGEFSLSGSATKAAITPTNIDIKNNSSYGCNGVKPARVGNELFYLQRASKKLYAMGFNAAADTFVSQDVTTLSEHITQTGIVDMAYQQEPDSILWLVRKDGQLATLTINTDQEVIGWSRQLTAGVYESVATIPSVDGSIDEVWTIVKREINGQFVRYIERFKEGVYSHCSALFQFDEGTNTLTGLTHLEGCTVDVVADDVVMQQRTVKNGTITLERKAKQIIVGLPYTTEIELLPIEIQGGLGSLQGSPNRSGELVLRVLNTSGCKINDEVVTFRELGKGVLDEPPIKFTGDKAVYRQGWDRPIVIQQQQPMPFQLLAAISKITVNSNG
ncbi:hypothetical protein DM558_00440 [Entomomonas moraniae]|uniref:Uncharacterized protein n=1 Tax=Entomomonas moraniae TaxID=2213226 RepID=A0A3S9XA94_9GAMM|nr:hypothetical protein [Entomomonas moraniae]AZS49337.1 hypothetical protein DM558_00440 [Entomomonas moraniae]